LGKKHSAALHNVKERVQRGFPPALCTLNNRLSEVGETETERLGINRKRDSDSSEDGDGDVDELRLGIRMDIEKPAIMAVRAVGHGDKNFLSFRVLAEHGESPAYARIYTIQK
jgi:hypothetical protein